VSTDSVQAMVQDFETKLPLFEGYVDKMKELVAELLEENNIKVHSIESRVKERPSLERKLRRSGANYSELIHVTDKCGVRIITHYADDVYDVYEVAKVIESEFAIDLANSVDKNLQLDPDKFGYISLHYVATISDTKMQLTEYRRYVDCVVEIQIRSILQHAWAEIEHDLGYKSEQAVPRDIRRRFSRLAGLLEIADSEFEGIRDVLKEYEHDLPRRLSDASLSVLIDKASLSAFISGSQKVTELDDQIASDTGAAIEVSAGEIDEIGELGYVGLKTIGEVEVSLDELGDIIVALAKEVLADGSHIRLPKGICIAYMNYVLVARKCSQEEVVKFLDSFSIDLPDHREEFAK